MYTVFVMMASILLSSMFLALGLISFGQPMVLGYIATGSLLGSIFGAILDPFIMHYVSEFAMMFLLFLVGLELDLEHLKQTWMTTVGCFVAQIFMVTLIMFIAAFVMGWSVYFSLLIAALILLSSTAVVVTLLDNFNMMKSKMGSIVVSILIIQDLSIVPVLLLLKNVNSLVSPVVMLIQMLGALGILVGCVLYFGKPLKDHMSRLEYKNLFRKPEVATLIGVTVCMTAAAVADQLQLSASYGAFLAGLIMGNRFDRQKLLDAFVPITSIMMMLFFFCVGMKVSFQFVKSNGIGLIWLTLAMLLIKLIINIIGFKIVQIKVRAALFPAALLSQMSEFSFVLIDVALDNGLINKSQSELFMTVTICSLVFGALFPLIVKTLQRIYQDRRKHGAVQMNWDF